MSDPLTWLNLQDFINDDSPDHIITKRRPVFRHNVYETIAQAGCSSMAVIKHIGGLVYAIRRACPHQQNCMEICNSLHLRVLDSETAHLPWSAIGALHVYTRRPSSTIMWMTSTQGLKVLWKNKYEYERGCGPNFCCCHVSKN